MNNLIEPLILYGVLFLPAMFSRIPSEGRILFSIPGEIQRLALHTLPGLALLWYLIREKRSIPRTDALQPRPRDMLILLAGLSGLILISFAVSLGAYLFPGTPPLPLIESPGDLTGWLMLTASCLGIGYLEESFFRLYLFEKLKKSFSGEWTRVFISSFFFSICHAYGGPWAVLNALSAGLFLSSLYLYWKSLHGIALAHGFYNVFVYGASLFFKPFPVP